jgi:hypothetical protein
MKLRIAIVSAALLLPLHAQDEPRFKASDYPAHVALPSLELGAEYMVHSIPGERGGYFAKEYLVVELALFPIAKTPLRVTSGQFTLRNRRAWSRPRSNIRTGSSGPK